MYGRLILHAVTVAAERAEKVNGNAPSFTKKQ